MQLLSFVRMSFIKLWECGVHGPYIISGNIYIYIYYERERERERERLLVLLEVQERHGVLTCSSLDF